MPDRPKLRHRLQAAWFALRGDGVMFNMGMQVEENRVLWLGVPAKFGTSRAFVVHNVFCTSELLLWGQRIPARETLGAVYDPPEPPGALM